MRDIAGGSQTPSDNGLFAEAISPAHRANPYPLYARLRQTPIALQSDGIYVVSGYPEIRALLFDPKMSSDVLPPPKLPRTGNFINDWIINPFKQRMIIKYRSLLFRDPPSHERLRRLVMLQLSPERIRQMQGRIGAIIDQLILRMRGRDEINLVEEFAYPLPITVICEILGAPVADEQKFHGWARTLAVSLDPDQILDDEQLEKITTDYIAMRDYLGALIKAKRRKPQDDVLSGLATFRDKKFGRMSKHDLVANAVLLMVAGHETTANLIDNAMLTLLRQPEYLIRLRDDPGLAPRLVDEVLRFDAPVQFIRRKALEDIEIAGARIPAGSVLVLLLASGNRDERRFADPDRFDPDRKNSQHLSFGGGIHFCIGAPLARIEAETALAALAARLKKPSLAADPPPYHESASVRGPQRLQIKIEGVA